MLVLGIETSCDETASAVYDTGSARVVSNVVASQVEIHRAYGGVVPELASREHVAVIDRVVASALEEAGVGLADVDAYAVTRGPGLVGALLVGLTFAKGLSMATGKPFVGVNHVEAHLTAAWLEGGDIRMPALGLVVSGGHTTLALLPSPGEYRVLGRTRDDAAGEALDKAAKLLDLGYPGGPVIERLAREAAEEGVEPVRLPRARFKHSALDFSFSGLKTALLYYVRDHPDEDVRALAAGFQEAVVEMIVSTVAAAAETVDAASLVAGGGVMCNAALRSALAEVAADAGLALFVPPPRLCADNAAMIAHLGSWHLARRGGDDLSADADAALALGEN